MPPVLLALALSRRASRKSACKDRSSLGSISRFVSARQLDLVYDRDRRRRQRKTDLREIFGVAQFSTFSTAHTRSRRSARKAITAGTSAVAENGRSFRSRSCNLIPPAFGRRARREGSRLVAEAGGTGRRRRAGHSRRPLAVPRAPRSTNVRC